MKLSIIIPTLNEEKYLCFLLESIKNQTFKDYEIIIADADSKDNTIEISKKFGCKITKGGLPAKARNLGAEIARGDLFLFLDADSVLPSQDLLKDLLREFKTKNLDVASFPIFPEGSRFDKLAYGIYNFWTNLTQNFLPHATSAVLIAKEMHKKVQGFDEQIKMAEDHDYVRRAAKFGKFGFIKTEPVLTSGRRFEKDGRAKTYLKFLLCGLYIFFLGPVKSDIFRYQYGHYDEK